MAHTVTCFVFNYVYIYMCKFRAVDRDIILIMWMFYVPSVFKGLGFGNRFYIYFIRDMVSFNNFNFILFS